jgi:hypothetical protein
MQGQATSQPRRPVLEDFARFWRVEDDADAGRQLLALIRALLPGTRSETPAKAMCKERERRDSNPRPPA